MVEFEPSYTILQLVSAVTHATANLSLACSIGYAGGIFLTYRKVAIASTVRV